MPKHVQPAAMTDATPRVVAPRDLTRTMLSVLLMLSLIGGSFWILRPFLLPLVWALAIVVATWPMMLAVQRALGRRGLAVAVMSCAMLLVFVIPVLLAIRVLLQNTDAIASGLKALATLPVPLPPDWVRNIPLAGASIADAWTNLASAGKEELTTRVAPYVSDVLSWLVAGVGGAGVLTVQFLLTIVIAMILYVNGEAARNALLRFGRRLAGERGEATVVLAGKAIRAVALGVVVTALAQTVLAGLGLAVAGVPFAGFLTALILVLCIAQIGPLIVLVPAVLWLFWAGHTGWAVALLVWSVPVGVMDNFIRPLLIRKGADLPLLLIFAGVIGGLLAFGIVGLFVGPVVLAVAYTLLKQWTSEHDAL